LALLVTVYFVYENFNQPVYTPQELAAKYFSPDERIGHTSLERTLSRDPDSSEMVKNETRKNLNAIWLEIENLYAEKQYDRAFEKLNTVQQLDPAFEAQSPDEFYFYEGL